MTKEEAMAMWDSFTPEQRLAMAKTAPSVAGPWHEYIPGRWMRNIDGSEVANAHHSTPGAPVEAGWYGLGLDGPHPSRDECMASQDARLIEEGVLLDNEPVVTE